MCDRRKLKWDHFYFEYKRLFSGRPNKFDTESTNQRVASPIKKLNILWPILTQEFASVHDINNKFADLRRL